jgi:hypothetical protein
MIGAGKATLLALQRRLMISFGQPIEYTVVQFGSLRNSAQLSMAMGLANQEQQSFHFDWGETLSFDMNRYKLPNSGYDLEEAVKDVIQSVNLPKPVILLTSLPYGDREHGSEPDYFFFSDHEYDKGISIISTYLWEQLPFRQGMQIYFLMMLATEVFSNYSGLEFHFDTRGCLFDYCDEPINAVKCLESGKLCHNCETYLQTKIRKGQLRLEHFVSAKRIFQRAAGKKSCFVVMPFNKSLKPVYDVIGQALKEEQWIVARADEMFRSRRITDGMVEAILTSDLVIADLTNNNPNVYYEVGLTHVLGRDLILITQEQTVPIDIAIERRITYSFTKAGLRDLSDQLKQSAGSGSF